MQQQNLSLFEQEQAKATPMIEQYLGIKRQYPETLLFYRMGDFYEMFFEDAVEAAAILDITLTSRGEHLGKPIPMCGVPVHNAESYLRRLIASGRQITICEQTESPEQAKKRGGSKALVEREAVRMVTAGTLVEDELLEPDRLNRLTAVAVVRDDWAMAWLELSSGTLHSQSIAPEQLGVLFSEIDPSEVLFEQALPKDALGLLQASASRENVQWTKIPRRSFQHDHARQQLTDAFNVEDYQSIRPLEQIAIAVLLGYLRRTQIGKLPRIQPPISRVSATNLVIDAATRRNLELTQTLAGEKKGTLLHQIDRCQTASGKRRLSEWLAAPLAECGAINRRLDKISHALDDSVTRNQIRETLGQTPDIDRPLSRIHLGHENPRDLQSIALALEQTATLRRVVANGTLDPSTRTAWADVNFPNRLRETLQNAFVDELPRRISDGGVIRSGYDETLDHQRHLRDNARRLLIGLERDLQRQSGVSSLKIKSNNMLGYFIEVPRKQAEMIDENVFIHRQTIKNTARYSTKSLLELANEILQAAAYAQAREEELYLELRDQLLAEHDSLRTLAALTAELDVVMALAHLAGAEGYCRPTLHPDQRFDIAGGRHPVVEKKLQEQKFIPNDCRMNDGHDLWLLSGPNMAGKSTFLRQNALIIILAQMGSYVPADSADIGVVDQLFSRVGAADDLARGHSTFMVEMMETAAILQRATARSFVILDEIGRGTATFDGLSIAWAVVEHLHDHIRARALFATHYHELSDSLEGNLERLKSYHLTVREWQGEIHFMFEVAAGRAAGSDGVHVAKLAGLPAQVTDRARQLLELFEHGDDHKPNTGTPPPLPQPAVNPLPEQIAAEITALDPDALTAREALDLLYTLRQRLKESP